MSEETKRTTVYLEPHLHKLLKLKAAEGNCSISDLVNESVKRSFKEDAIDLAAVGLPYGPSRPGKDPLHTHSVHPDPRQCSSDR